MKDKYIIPPEDFVGTNENVQNQNNEQLAEMYMDKVVKMLFKIIAAVIIGIVAYIIFTKYSDVWLIGNFISAAGEIPSELHNYLAENYPNINLDIILSPEGKLFKAFQIYCISSVPWAYIGITKRTGIEISIIGLAIAVIKLGISIVTGPILMPIAIVISVASMVKNFKLFVKYSN
ncbi:MAG: hypothetical protein ACLUFN_00805 [Eubacterium sp.]